MVHAHDDGVHCREPACEHRAGVPVDSSPSRNRLDGILGVWGGFRPQRRAEVVMKSLRRLWARIFPNKQEALKRRVGKVVYINAEVKATVGGGA